MYSVTETQVFVLPHGAGVEAAQRMETPTLAWGEQGKWSLTHPSRC